LKRAKTALEFSHVHDGSHPSKLCVEILADCDPMYDSPPMKSCLSIALVAALGLAPLHSFALGAEAVAAGAKPAAKVVKKQTKRHHTKSTAHGRTRPGVTQVKSVQKVSLPPHASRGETHPRVMIDHEHGEPAAFVDAPLWAEAQAHEDMATSLGRAVRGVRPVKATAKVEESKRTTAKREIEVGLEKPSPKANAKSDTKAEAKADQKIEKIEKIEENTKTEIKLEKLDKSEAKPDPKVDVKTEISIEEHATPEAKPVPTLAARTAKNAKSDAKAVDGADKGDKSDKSDCTRVSTEVYRGPEAASFVLSRCDTDSQLASRLSAILRPVSGTLADPKSKMASTKVDPRLVSRLAQVADHFARPGEPVRMNVISGIRPSTQGSQHAHGRAIDLRIEGVANEKLIEFCKSLNDTGCGYYPNSSFVHVDVRDPGTGHIYWIDASVPGETPRYLTSWPEEK